MAHKEPIYREMNQLLTIPADKHPYLHREDNESNVSNVSDLFEVTHRFVTKSL